MLVHEANTETSQVAEKEENEKETQGKRRKVKEIVKSDGERERAGGEGEGRRMWGTLKEQHS